VVAKSLGYRNQRFWLQRPVLVIGTIVLVVENLTWRRISDIAADSGCFNMAADSGYSGG